MSFVPKVSIIVPIYKVERYLRQCVESLLAQTMEEIEIILVDDGSPDGCGSICEEYASMDMRIQVIHQKNQGLLRARISGVQLAKADYIGFVDGDDFVKPEMYEVLWETAVAKNAQVVCCSEILYWNEGHTELPDPLKLDGTFSGARLEEEFYPQFFYDRTAQSKGCIPPAVWNKIFKRELLLAVYQETDPTVTIGEDMVISYACMLRATCICVLAQSYLYYYRQRSNSMIQGYWPDYLKNLKKQVTLLEQLPKPAQATHYIEEAIERYVAVSFVLAVRNEWRKPNQDSKIQLLGQLYGDCFWEKYLTSPPKKMFPLSFDWLIYWAVRKRAWIVLKGCGGLYVIRAWARHKHR